MQFIYDKDDRHVFDAISDEYSIGTSELFNEYEKKIKENLEKDVRDIASMKGE